MTVDESYQYCERIARDRAKNFYYSFLLLPRPKRLAMCAIYAFMRECDDRSDGPDAALEKVRQWRSDLDAALNGHPPDHPLWPAFRDTAQRFAIPSRYFHEMLDGVSSDFDARTIRTFDDLYRYCYLVASIVGLTIIHIFGFDDPQALPLAEKCGIAFQLTNILRDVKEDALAGRIYLPEEDLARYGVSPADLGAAKLNAPLRALLEFEAARARDFYAQSQPLLALVNRDSRNALWALIEVYRRLLLRIEAEGFPVLEKRVSLPLSEKLLLLARAGLGLTNQTSWNL
jgi:phytoene synthase